MAESIVRVQYDELRMELVVQLSTGTWKYAAFHLGDYRAFQQAGFSYDYFIAEIQNHFPCMKA